jgi:hypothetical protein
MEHNFKKRAKLLQGGQSSVQKEESFPQLAKNFISGRRVAKLVARLLATVAPWVRIQISLYF